VAKVTEDPAGDGPDPVCVVRIEDVAGNEDARHGGAPDRHAEHHLVEDGLNPRTERRRQAPNEVPHAYTGDVRSRHLAVITFQGRGGARLL